MDKPLRHPHPSFSIRQMLRPPCLYPHIRSNRVRGSGGKNPRRGAALCERTGNRVLLCRGALPPGPPANAIEPGTGKHASLTISIFSGIFSVLPVSSSRGAIACGDQGVRAPGKEPCHTKTGTKPEIPEKKMQGDQAEVRSGTKTSIFILPIFPSLRK